MSPQASREKAQTRLGAEEEPEFQIAPMIDILLVLLVFFMSISSTEVLQRSNNVTLPAATQGQRSTDAGQALVNVTWSSIDQTGAIEIDGRHFTQPASVRDYLRGKTAVNPDLRVLIRADRQVRYDFLRPLMVAAGQAEVKKVTFSVVEHDRPPTH